MKALLHPAALVSLAVLLVNDHVLKARYGNAITGKLSDFAGMVVAPLVLAAIVEAVAPRLRRDGVAWGSAAAVAIGFALVKAWAPATHAYEACFEMIWRGHVTLVRDATDLVALPMGALAAMLHSGAHVETPAPTMGAP